MGAGGEGGDERAAEVAGAGAGARAPHGGHAAHGEDWRAALPPEVAAAADGRIGRLAALPAIGFLLLLLALAGWWLQDAVATVVNEGEADVGSEVAFAASAGTYRVVTSGPTKPDLSRTLCAVALSDGRSLEILGGTGSVHPVERFATARVVEFDAPAGRTRVSCSDRLSPRHTGGRFQVVAADGPVSRALTGAALVGALALAGGIALALLRRRRA